MTHRTTADRSPSPQPDSEPSLLKRLKSSHISDVAPASTADPTPHFAPDLFGPSNIHRLHTEYDTSGPFKHVVVDKLFQDDLLQRVKDEALSELSFSEKETDIYKASTVFFLCPLPAPTRRAALALHRTAPSARCMRDVQGPDGCHIVCRQSTPG